MPEAFSDARARVGSLANVQDDKLVQVMLDTMVFELQDDDVETSDAISSDAFGVEAEVRVPPDGCAYNLVEFPAFFGAEEGRKTWDEAHQAYSGPFCAFGNSWTNTYLNAYDYINWGAMRTMCESCQECKSNLCQFCNLNKVENSPTIPSTGDHHYIDLNGV